MFYKPSSPHTPIDDLQPHDAHTGSSKYRADKGDGAPDQTLQTDELTIVAMHEMLAIDDRLDAIEQARLDESTVADELVDQCVDVWSRIKKLEQLLDRRQR